MTSDLFNIEDKVIVVTGGMGQLGQQFTKVLLNSRAKVAILDCSIKKIALQANLRRHIENKRLVLIHADVTKRESLEQALVKIQEKWGRTPYGLINNAALDSPPGAPAEETGLFEDFPDASWDRVMNVNVKGVFLACQVFGKAMADAGAGSIINIGSTYGMVSPDHRIYEYKEKNGGESFYKPVAYSASKSALVNLTKYIAVYWAKSGVRTNLMGLGGVFNNQDEEFMQGYCNKVPMGRMANADEYNGTVVYLMSNASSYVTGTTIMLDGGWTAW
jgi:NAD(P)-dependent dehydrogenase (short-subunit alcohol dehydrogenase family)|tara:strand:+ start:3122 stop:3946 length:825 start_codon:yes stop_codon:yes gene_type:complete